MFDLRYLKGSVASKKKVGPEQRLNSVELKPKIITFNLNKELLMSGMVA